MHRILFGLLGLLIMPGVASASEWRYQDLSAALEEAAGCEGEILLDVYTTWCGPCRRLAEEVFPSAPFTAAAEEMILVKVDAESGDGPEIARRYAVVGYPTVLVLDAHGNELGRLFGYSGPEEFAATLTEIRFGAPSLAEFLDDYSRVTRSGETFATTFEVGFDAVSCGHYDMADQVLEAIVRIDDDNSSGFASSALLVLGKYRHLRGSEDPDTAITYFERIIDQFPDSSEFESAIVQSGIAHARAGRSEESLQSFERYLSIDPGDSGRANSVAFSMVRESIDLERAREIATSGLESAPDDDSLWDTLAEVHFALGDADAALEAIDRAIELAPENGYYPEQRARFDGQ